MRRTVEDEQILKRYLLDDLAPEERRRLEERLLDDGDDFIDQLEVAEAELADDYVTGGLSDADRVRFEEYFLSTPERHEQLRFAEMIRGYFSANEPLKKTVADEPPPRLPWLQKFSSLLGLNRPVVGFALSCGLVLAVGVAAWLGVRASRLRLQLERLQAQQPSTPDTAEAHARLQQQLAEERARRESATQELSREQSLRAGLEQELARLRAGASSDVAEAKPPPGQIIKPNPQPGQRGPAPRVLAVTLMSGAVRGPGETKALSLTPATTTVRLRLDIGAGDHKHYRATLETTDGEPLLAKDVLRPVSERGGRSVIFDVPAKLLRGGGDFQVRLGGLTRADTAEELGRYYFRVQRN